MIINFSVKNFGSIKDEVTLSFEANNSADLEDYYIIEPKKGLRLLKLGLIFGPNASGKTTVLKALDFLRDLILDPLTKKTDTLEFSPFLFDENTPTENTIFKIEFFQEGIKFDYEIEFNKEYILKEKLDFYEPRNASVFERVTNPEKQLSKIKLGSKFKDENKIKKDQIRTLENNTLWNNTVLGAYLKTNIEARELGIAIDWFENTLKPLIKPNTNLYAYVSTRLEDGKINKHNLLTILNQADFKISDIIISSSERDIDDTLLSLLKQLQVPEGELGKMEEAGKIERKEVRFQHTVNNEKKYSLPYSDESMGTKRYYQFSGLLDLMLRENTIFSLDELESSLHPDLLEHFLLTFLVNAKKSQLISTTHYRELLIKKDILRPDAIWFTEKQANGSTDLFSLDDFDTSIVRFDTSSIYNAYRTGKLGATPNLGDYYIDLEDGEA